MGHSDCGSSCKGQVGDEEDRTSAEVTDVACGRPELDLPPPLDVPVTVAGSTFSLVKEQSLITQDSKAAFVGYVDASLKVCSPSGLVQQDVSYCGEGPVWLPVVDEHDPGYLLCGRPWRSANKYPCVDTLNDDLVAYPVGHCSALRDAVDFCDASES